VASIKAASLDGPGGIWTNGSVRRIRMLDLNLNSPVAFVCHVELYQDLPKKYNRRQSPGNCGSQ
jgi:hypothetical protein